MDGEPGKPAPEAAGQPETTRDAHATELLIRVRQGQPGAADELVPLLYDQLRAIAGQMLGKQPGGTLSPTVLVHEAYLRMIRADRTEPCDREHFCALAATAMRSTLIDYVRAKHTVKRGGRLQRGVLDENQAAPEDPGVDILALDAALRSLEREHPRVARIIELRFFGGLGVRDTAAILELSESTIEKQTRFGRAYLQRELA